MSSAFGDILSEYYVYNEVMEDGSEHLDDAFPAQYKINNNNNNNSEDYGVALIAVVVFAVILAIIL